MCPTLTGPDSSNMAKVMVGADIMVIDTQRTSLDSSFSMFAMRSMLPNATIPNKAYNKKNEKRGKRRRRPDLDEYEDALLFLQRFHATTAQSLHAISEDYGDGCPLVPRKRKFMRKTRTYRCLSSLADDHLEATDVSTNSRRYSAPPCSTARDDLESGWGFFEAETMSMTSLEDFDFRLPTSATTSLVSSR